VGTTDVDSGSKVDLQSAVVGPRDASLDGTALANCNQSSQLQGRLGLHDLAPPYLSALLGRVV